jgi:hypothetical protein
VQKLRDSIALRLQDPTTPAAFKTAAPPVDTALATLMNGPTSVGAAHRDLTRRLNDQIRGRRGAEQEHHRWR